jgi:hypothetical protein
VRRYLEAIRAGKGDLDDREAAGELVDEVESLLQRVGSGTRIDDVSDAYKAAYRALSAVLQRLGVAHANPYRDLWRFYRSWEEKQLSSYASRRAYASELYEPVRLELDKLEWARLVEPVANELGRDRRPCAGAEGRVRSCPLDQLGQGHRPAGRRARAAAR